MKTLNKLISFIAIITAQAIFQFDTIAKETTDLLFEGKWSGIPEGRAVELQFEITQEKDGRYTATISPDKGVNKAIVSSITIFDNNLSLQVGAESVTYVGDFNPSSKIITGELTQGKQKYPLNLKKTKTPKIITLNRPQEPTRPYPYRSEEVTFANKQAMVTLAGTLTQPKTPGPHPAVILISGSGPQNRDQLWMGHRTFLVLADHLTKNGIAVLRVDDRGYAKSSGNFSSATSLDFADDTQAALNYLKSRTNIDHENIGLIGHSEGGLIAPIVATRSNDVAFIVLMAGPGISGLEISNQQFIDALKAYGVSNKSIESARVIYNELNTASFAGDTPIPEAKLNEIYLEQWDKLDKTVQAELSKLGGGKLSQQRIESLRSPWNRYFLSHQPRTYLSKINIPVLAINGSKDVQMHAKPNLSIIKHALKQAANSNFKVVELAGLNHLFQHADTGSIAEYSKIEETFATSALELISNWILNTAVK